MELTQHDQKLSARQVVRRYWYLIIVWVIIPPLLLALREPAAMIPPNRLDLLLEQKSYGFFLKIIFISVLGIGSIYPIVRLHVANRLLVLAKILPLGIFLLSYIITYAAFSISSR